MSTTTPDPSLRKRRRVRAAEKILRRVGAQRDALTSDYGKATTAPQRFAVVSSALRAATAPGHHQPDPAGAERRLDRLTDLMLAHLNELHTEQSKAAERTIRAEERRIRRAERRLT